MQFVAVLERREEQVCLADFKTAVCLLVRQALLSCISQPGGAELVDTWPLVLPVSRTGVKFPHVFSHRCCAESGQAGGAGPARPLTILVGLSLGC